MEGRAKRDGFGAQIYNINGQGDGRCGIGNTVYKITITAHGHRWYEASRGDRLVSYVTVKLVS